MQQGVFGDAFRLGVQDPMPDFQVGRDWHDDSD